MRQCKEREEAAMYHIVVCDDEKEMAEQILSSVKANLTNQNELRYTCIYESEKLLSLLQREVVDVLFLDIDMPVYTGMDIAQYICRQNLNTLLIFVTSHDALVYQTFSYRPFGFLRKSYMEQEIKEVAMRLEEELKTQSEVIILQRNGELIPIPKSQIIFMEAEGNYLNIHKIHGVEKYRDTLFHMEQELGHKEFIRCHKGYLVNCRHIVKMSQNQLEMSNSKRIPVGRNYEKEVKRKILESMRR
ncbi:MAG: LytTR family DNA-binding domain-containing protein [Lachnospiraceae bacterium]|nr:LytTR family DNA-binding domain-containing protein [Lachnospiraceae bacterium]